MKVLGISTSHNASICQVTDGKIDFYFEEDRFNKTKNWCPNSKKEQEYLSIKERANIEYDKVIIASFDRRFPNNYTGDLDKNINSNILKQLKGNPEVYFFSYYHHLYHAYSGFYFSNFEDAICIVMDGAGAQPYFSHRKFCPEVESIYYLNKFEHKLLCKHLSNARYVHNKDDVIHPSEYINIDGVDLQFGSMPSSGHKFGALTHRLGLGDGNESGKTMGLASYGNLTGDRPEDLARQLQEETKLDTIELIKKAISYNDCKNIVLSGGYALNCVNNYEYLKEFPNHNFFVDPVAHDGGTAIGAALWAYQNAK